MPRRKDPPPTDILRQTRARLAQKELESTGSTGRVIADRRVAHGFRVDLRIPLDEIREPELRVKETLPASWLTDLLADPSDEPWRASGDAQIDLSLVRDAQTVRVRGQSSAQLSHVCVRCLETVPFDLALELDLRLVARNDPELAEDELAFESGMKDWLEGNAEAVDLHQADEVPFDGRIVDVAAVLREQMFLELPMHPACESPGANPSGPCVVDREGALAEEQSRWVDPRWAGLMALKDRLES